MCPKCKKPLVNNPPKYSKKLCGTCELKVPKNSSK